jgi:hypothetical protein
MKVFRVGFETEEMEKKMFLVKKRYKVLSLSLRVEVRRARSRVQWAS